MRDVGLFELGLVFEPRKAGSRCRCRSFPCTGVPRESELAVADALRPKQPQHVAVAFTGLAEPAGWWGAGRAADWTDAVEAAQTIAAAADVELSVSAANHAPWHPGPVCAVGTGRRNDRIRRRTAPGGV